MVGGQRHAPAASPSHKRHDTHCTESWVEITDGLEGYGKSNPPPEADPWTVQPVFKFLTTLK